MIPWAREDTRLVLFETRLMLNVKDVCINSQNDEQYLTSSTHPASQFQETVNVSEENHILPINRRHRGL